MATILGLDPGSRMAGFGVISIKNSVIKSQGWGVIDIPKALNFSQKLDFLDLQLAHIFQQYQPTATVVEKIFLGKNVDSAFKLGQVRGVCLMQASRHRTKTFEYAARSVKKVVTGSGAASKEHVQSVVSRLLGVLINEPLDATDALALALCHARFIETEEKLRQAEERIR